MEHLPWFPQRASTLAATVDQIYFAWLLLSGLVALAIAVLIVVFVWRYRTGSAADRRLPEGAALEHATHWIEAAWMLVPLAIFLAMFVWSARAYVGDTTAPAGAMPVYVVGKQWMWHLEHAGGQREIGELHVPLGRPVQLVMTSQDVIHSFSVPGFRVKQDVLPGRYTTLWFEPDRAGEFRIFCTQYCGTAHSDMVGRVVVMAPADFERWLAAHAVGDSMPGRGARLFRELGCSGCHGPHAGVAAPPLAGVYGRRVALAGGGTVLADEDYLREVLLWPGRRPAAGYAPTMPSYQGQLDEQQLLELLAYLRSLGDLPGATAAATTPAGEAP